MEKTRFPEKIKAVISDRLYQTDNIGMSGSNILLFDDMVLKIQKHGFESENEYKILQYLDGKLPVPKPIVYESDGGYSYLLMSKTDGKMLCDDEYMKNPELLLSLVSEVFSMLWSVDISDCPCHNNLDVKLKWARYNVENNLVDIDNTEPDTFGENGFENPSELLKWLETHRPPEDLTLTHGDFCLPNLFAKGRNISGLIDLGRAGISDKWQDIAICYRSLKHNFSGRYNGGIPYEGYSPEMLFECLHIEPDNEKLRYYLLLDELF